MKKIKRLFATLLCVVTVFCVLTACVRDTVADFEGPYVTIKVSLAQEGGFKADAVVKDMDGNKTSYTAIADASHIGDLIDALKEEGLSFLALGSKTDEWGRKVEEIGGLTADSSKNEFIAIYTTSDDLKYSFLETSAAVENKTYYSCNYGIDTMPVFSGMGYLFIVDSF